MTWRDVLSIHPAAELFPLMSPDELRELGKDVVKNGLTSPIALWQGDHKSPVCLLDGRNRLDAIELATRSEVVVGAPSITAGRFLAINKVITLDKSVDPYAYVVSANLHRRHLTAEQRRELVEELLRAQPEKSDRQIAAMAKVDGKTAGAVRRELEGRAEIPHVSTRTDTKGRAQPARKAPRKSANKPKGRAAAASSAKPPREDIAAASTGEVEQLRARNDELEREVARLKSEILALRSEIDALKAKSR